MTRDSFLKLRYVYLCKIFLIVEFGPLLILLRKSKLKIIIVTVVFVDAKILVENVL